jgi:hypothetical protein
MNAQTVIRLRAVQDQIVRLKAERDALIRECNGELGVRELGRFLGMSAAQVSRIQRGPVRQGAK